MSSDHPLGRVAGAFPICFLMVTLSFAQTPPPPSAVGSFPLAELDQAKKVVTSFCADWRMLKIDSMYVMMCEASQANMPKLKFTSTYGARADKSGKLSSFAVKDATLGDSGIVGKVGLTIVKQTQPVAVNGIHSFHLVGESGKWMVKTIVPPIAPPRLDGTSGGSHPGE